MRAQRVTRVVRIAVAVACLPTLSPARADAENGGFESGGFEGWVADPNWVVVDNSCGYYSGWGGKWWAWSGGEGEPLTGALTSKPFVLDKQAVSLLISGWSSIRGTGQPRRWNYATLNLEDGTEIDRVYAPDTTEFVTAWLDGSEHEGAMVYIEAVDDADQPTFSMLCVDEVRTADLPARYAQPVGPLPKFSPKTSARLGDEKYLVEVSRENGSITRLADKESGLDLILEPRLAGSFRFALPIPGKEPWQTVEANWIFGRDQRISSCEEGGRKLTLRWDGPLLNYLGEEFDASAVMSVELAEGGVLFRLSIDNRSPYPVGETYFPVLGGIQGLGRTYGHLKATEMIRPAPAPEDTPAPDVPAGACTTATIFRVFNSMSWLGDQGPEQYYGYPNDQPAPWIGFHSPKAHHSALLCARDPVDRDLWIRLELVPASSGTTREDGNWPRPDELDGQPVGVELSFVDPAVGPPGDAYEAAPVLLRFLGGGGPEMWRAYTELEGRG
jgi:hypothetical protein